MRIFRFLFCFFAGKRWIYFFHPPLSQAPPDSSPSGRALLVGCSWEQGLPILRKKPPLCKGRWRGNAVTEGL